MAEKLLEIGKEPADITFWAKATEVLKLCEDGKFLVRGKEVTKDVEVYEALKSFLYDSWLTERDWWKTELKVMYQAAQASTRLILELEKTLRSETEKVRRLVEAGTEVEVYLSTRVEKPDRGVKGREVILPLLRGALAFAKGEKKTPPVVSTGDGK